MILDMINFCPPGTPITARRALKTCCKSGVSINPAGTVVSSTVPDVTEPDATSSSLAAIGPHDGPRHAGQVVRRVLQRRNIVINAETAQLAAAQSAFQGGTPSRTLGIIQRKNND